MLQHALVLTATAVVTILVRFVRRSLLTVDRIGGAGTDSVREDHHPAQDSERSEQDAGLESAAGEYRASFACLCWVMTGYLGRIRKM